MNPCQEQTDRRSKSMNIAMRKMADQWIREHEAEHLVTDLQMYKRLSHYLHKRFPDHNQVRRCAQAVLVKHLLDTASEDEADQFKEELEAHYAGRTL